MIAAPVVTGLVLAWLFSLEGTLDMYQWIVPFQALIILIGVLGISGPLLAWLSRGRRGLRIASTLLAVLGILVPLVFGGVYLRGALQFAAATPPLLLLTSSTGANGLPNLALVFRTAQATQNTLSYGEALSDHQYAEPSAAREHILPLNDLKPGTRYQWRLNNGSACSFTTPSDTLYHFAVGGDPHLTAGSGAGDPTILPAVLKYVTDPAQKFQIFFLMGDFVNMGSSYADWQFALNLAAPFTCSLPLRPLMGNHDTFLNGAPQYLAYLYPQGIQTNSGSRLYYRIDTGRIHILMLKVLWGADSFNAEQQAWLVKQLESIPPEDWKIVMMHSAVYASGSVLGGKPYYDPAGMLQKIAPLFEKNKVDLVITGHAHHLEFLQKNGVNYAIAGGLGAPLDTVATNMSVASVWYLPQQYGFIDATIQPASIELHFRDPNGKELKSFTIGKNQ
jgi:hypothetical protein